MAPTVYDLLEPAEIFQIRTKPDVRDPLHLVSQAITAAHTREPLLTKYHPSLQDTLVERGTGLFRIIVGDAIFDTALLACDEDSPDIPLLFADFVFLRFYAGKTAADDYCLATFLGITSNPIKSLPELGAEILQILNAIERYFDVHFSSNRK